MVKVLSNEASATMRGLISRGKTKPRLKTEPFLAECSRHLSPTVSKHRAKLKVSYSKLITSCIYSPWLSIKNYPFPPVAENDGSKRQFYHSSVFWKGITVFQNGHRTIIMHALMKNVQSLAWIIHIFITRPKSRKNRNQVLGRVLSKWKSIVRKQKDSSRRLNVDSLQKIIDKWWREEVSDSGWGSIRGDAFNDSSLRVL